MYTFLLFVVTGVIGAVELYGLTKLCDWLEEKYPQYFLQMPEDTQPK